MLLEEFPSSVECEIWLLLDAISEAHLITTIYGYETYIYKCMIPEDTKYYEGRFNCTPSYCSESIIIEEPANTSFLEL